MSDNEHRELVGEMFELLRKRHEFKTIEGTICCGSCAVAKLNSMGVSGQPCAYYHEQDAEIYETDKDLRLYIGYGWIESDRPSEEVGYMVAAAAVEVGLKVDWNGEGTSKIIVGLREE